jgi:hypothetical protein
MTSEHAVSRCFAHEVAAVQTAVADEPEPRNRVKCEVDAGGLQRQGSLRDPSALPQWLPMPQWPPMGSSMPSTCSLHLNSQESCECAYVSLLMSRI